MRFAPGTAVSCQVWRRRPCALKIRLKHCGCLIRRSALARMSVRLRWIVHWRLTYWVILAARSRIINWRGQRPPRMTSLSAKRFPCLWRGKKKPPTRCWCRCCNATVPLHGVPGRSCLLPVGSCVNRLKSRKVSWMQVRRCVWSVFSG